MRIRGGEGGGGEKKSTWMKRRDEGPRSDAFYDSATRR